MTIQQELINHYCQLYSTENSELLQSVERTSELSTADPTMISDFSQGRILSLISTLLQPSNILEIGTFVGYSTICLAEGLQPNGRIVTIEKNRDYLPLILKNIKDSDIADRAEIKIGRAMKILVELDLSIFNLIFIDAAKKEYQRYFDLIIDDIRKGSVIIVDNVLWKGQVTDYPMPSIASSLHKFNSYISQRKDIKNFILPFRDGLNIITKI